MTKNAINPSKEIENFKRHGETLTAKLKPMKIWISKKVKYERSSLGRRYNSFLVGIQ